MFGYLNKDLPPVRRTEISHRYPACALQLRDGSVVWFHSRHERAMKMRQAMRKALPAQATYEGVFYSLERVPNE